MWINLLPLQDLQLQTEGNAKHLEALHLKVHPDGCFVGPVERSSAEPEEETRKTQNFANKSIKNIWESKTSDVCFSVSTHNNLD